MVHVPPSPEAVGLPQLPLDVVVEKISTLPFASSMRAMSILAAELHHHAADPVRQVQLAGFVYRDPIASAVLRFMQGGPGRFAFDPRHVSSMQRLLVLHAADEDEPRDMTPTEIAILGEALFSVGDALPGGEPVFDGDPSTPEQWADWARYTTLLSAWHHMPDLTEALAKAHSWYVDAHKDPMLATHPARCDIDQWLVDDLGLTLGEQFAGGLACLACTQAFDPSAGLEQRARAIPVGFLRNGALGSKEAAVRASISATRDELVSMMTAAGNDAARVAWDHTAFEQRPFLRRSDGAMVLISPTALSGWMTRGMHHRALQAAERRPHATKPGRSMAEGFLAYSGALAEHAFRRLVARSHETQVRAGLLRIHDEQAYKIGKSTYRSPDLGLDFGPDLVLIELYSGRISREARTSLDSALLRQQLDKATTVKLAQLAKRIRDLLAGRPVFAGLDLRAVERVWPLLVLAGDAVLQTPALWTYLQDAAPDAFIEDPRVQAPQIFGLDDFEPLLSLIQEEGAVMPQLLQTIAHSPFALVPARNWVHATFGGVTRRPFYTEEQSTSALKLAIETIYPGASSRIT
jgi:hypothetical protein